MNEQNKRNYTPIIAFLCLALLFGLGIAFIIHVFTSAERMSMSNDYYQMSIDTYKASCDELPYDTLAQDTTGTYDGQKVHFTGQVAQVVTISNRYAIYLINVTATAPDTFIDTVYVFNLDMSTRLSAGDPVSFWGESDGLYTITTETNQAVTLPRVNAAYIENTQID